MSSLEELLDNNLKCEEEDCKSKEFRIRPVFVPKTAKLSYWIVYCIKCYNTLDKVKPLWLKY